MTNKAVDKFLENYNENHKKIGFKLFLEEAFLDDYDFNYRQRVGHKFRLTKKVNDFIMDDDGWQCGADCDITTKLLMSMYNLYLSNKYLKRASYHHLGLSNRNIQPKLVDIQTNEIKSFELSEINSNEERTNHTTIKTEVEVIPPTKEFLEKYEFLLMYNGIEHIITLKLTEEKICEVYIDSCSDHPTKTKTILKGQNKGKEVPIKIHHSECIGYAYFKHKSQVARNHQPNVVGDKLYFDGVPALFICVNKDPENDVIDNIPRKKYQSYKIVDNNMQSLSNEDDDEGIYICEV